MHGCGRISNIVSLPRVARVHQDGAGRNGWATRGAPAGQLAERQQHRGQHREPEESAAATGPAVRNPAPKSRPLAERDIADRRKRRFRIQEWPVPCAGASPNRSPADHEQRLAASPPAATWGPQGPIAHAVRTPRVPYTERARTIGAARWPWPLRALLLLPAVFLLLLWLPPPPVTVPLMLTLENTKPSALRQRSCPGQTPPFLGRAAPARKRDGEGRRGKDVGYVRAQYGGRDTKQAGKRSAATCRSRAGCAVDETARQAGYSTRPRRGPAAPSCRRPSAKRARNQYL